MRMAPIISGTSLAIFLAISALLVLCLRAVFRLFFHPLSSIPGPKLAAVTGLYDFYYDCILGGKFVFKIEELHKQYGRP